MRRRPKPLPCRSVILNEDQRRLGPLKRASRVKSDTRAQALRPAAWWNGRHSRLKICTRKGFRFESGRGHHLEI
jgi:hypothetical protein